MITKRRFFGTAMGIAVALPVGRIMFLKSLDNPLPEIASPELILIDDWVLAKQDVNTGETG